MKLQTLAPALALAWWGGLTAVAAHPAFLTSAELTVAADGSFHGRAEFDTLAFALNDTSARIGNEPMEELLAGPREALAAKLSDAKGRFLRGFQVTTDAGPGEVDQIDFPSADAILQWRDARRPVLPVVIPVTLSGHLPTGAHRLAVRFPAVLEQVILSVERPGEEPTFQPVEAGAESPPLPVELAANATARVASGRTPRDAQPPAPPGKAAGALAYWQTGDRFPLAFGGLILLSFAGAFGWSKLEWRQRESGGERRTNDKAKR